jgi:glycosyltransferase involved in cell wall biosynthesis
MPGKTPCVLFINHWAKKLGGAEYSLLDILSSISTRCRPYLVTSESGLLTSRAGELGIECHIIPCSLKPGKDMRGNILRTVLFSGSGIFSFFQFVRLLSHFIKQTKPEIIHANVPLSHMALFLLSVFGFRGTCVFHVREIFKKHSLPFFLYQGLFPRKRGHIIAISESVRRHLPVPLKGKSAVIYNGVKVPGSLPQPTNFPRTPARFLYLGRIVPWKGCHDLVDMFAKVYDLRSHHTWSLTLVGDTTYWSDSYRKELEGLMRSRGLAQQCALLPHTEDPAAVIRSHDVFVNASFNEPFGRSIAEAQAEGLPVVAFDSGGIREIVEHEKTGLLIPFGDKEGFVEAILRMIDSRDDAMEMGKRGHDRMKLLFNRDVQIPKICEEILRQNKKLALPK